MCENRNDVRIEAGKRRRAAEKSAMADGSLRARLGAMMVDPDFGARTRSAWDRVHDDIRARALAAAECGNPRKIYEVQHEIEAARDAFTINVVSSEDPEWASGATIARLTELPEVSELEELEEAAPEEESEMPTAGMGPI